MVNQKHGSISYMCISPITPVEHRQSGRVPDKLRNVVKNAFSVFFFLKDRQLPSYNPKTEIRVRIEE